MTIARANLKNILVHACCGPCAATSSAPYFFNGDNFDTLEEYKRRLDAFNKLDEKKIIEPYSPKSFENCDECIRYRLVRCAKAAIQNGYNCFTTTLTISPHKNTEQINNIGRAIGQEYGIEFIEQDLKKDGGFQKSVVRSKELGMYRQRYCGCKK